jgi:hypothetical protein
MWLAFASYCGVLIQNFTINRILHFEITHKAKLLDNEEIKHFKTCNYSYIFLRFRRNYSLFLPKLFNKVVVCYTYFVGELLFIFTNF